MALTVNVKDSVSATLTRSADFESASSTIADASSFTLTDGTGAGQADVIFKDTRTLTASATEDLDLSGALTNIYGVTTVFARIKYVRVSAASANTNNVNVSRPAANGVPLFLAASDAIPVRPGGFVAWGCTDATGIAVTAGTGDLLTLTNSAGGTSVTYNITIVGASA